MKKFQQCLLCSGPADTKETKEFLKGFCTKCKQKFKVVQKKNKRESNFENIEQLIKNISDILYNFNKKPGLREEKPSVIFNGEIRPLNIEEQNKSIDLLCPYCELPIDRKLYFSPLVIHKCGNAYYHRQCFAKLMAEKEYKCSKCKRNFFTTNDKSAALYDSTDSDESGDKYF